MFRLITLIFGYFKPLSSYSVLWLDTLPLDCNSVWSYFQLQLESATIPPAPHADLQHLY